MSKRFIVALLLCAAMLGGIFWFKRDKAGAPAANASQAQPSNHVEGENKKGVTLVEYGDFQCPACGAYYPVLKNVKEKHLTDITFQFRNFPLTQIHPNAFAAHRAAEAASIQGKFWEMHNLLYERQQSWSGASNSGQIFQDFASELGLNVEKFKLDSASSAVNSVINADIKQGQNLGADSTPTFVLDGKKIEQNPKTPDAFNKLIEDAIVKKAGEANPKPAQ